MRLAKRLLLILSVVACCAGCDRVSKTYAEARLSRTQAVSFLAGSLRLQLSHNEGAFLSLGASLPKPWREAIFRGGVACVLAGLLAYAVFRARPSAWSVGGASLVFAGGSEQSRRPVPVRRLRRGFHQYRHRLVSHRHLQRRRRGHHGRRRHAFLGSGHRDAVDLDVERPRKGRDAEEDARGRSLGEIARIDLVELVEARGVGAVNVALHHALERGPGSLQAALHLLEHDFHLLAEWAPGRFAGVRAARRQPGQQYE